MRKLWAFKRNESFDLGIDNTTSFQEVVYAVTTEWPWPWHPDIHWYHQYLNLSSVGPEIWDGLHLAILTGFPKYNRSHFNYKWIAQVLPNITAMNELHKNEYEGTEKEMFGCWPAIYGQYPDWITFEQKWRCGFYTPELRAYLSHQKDFGFVYNFQKPFVDISIGIGTVVTSIGVPGM